MGIIYIQWNLPIYFILFYFIFLGMHMAYGSSQAKGLIGAPAAGLHHSHSNARFELDLQPTPQLMATLDPEPTQQGQGLNLQPHGS